jgi:hypothetical protein
MRKAKKTSFLNHNLVTNLDLGYVYKIKDFYWVRSIKKSSNI